MLNALFLMHHKLYSVNYRIFLRGYFLTKMAYTFGTFVRLLVYHYVSAYMDEIVPTTVEIESLIPVVLLI